jgi:hypothetical protein
MHKETAAGWVAQSLGREVAFTSGGLKSATGSVTLSTGAAGSVDGITVNGVQIMSGAVAYATSLSNTASLVAANINAYASTPEYFARANGAVITITAFVGGTAPNGFVVTPTFTTITGSSANMAGGGDYELVDGAAIVGAISGATATVTRVVQESGDWLAGTAAGRLVFATQTGTFQAETLNVGSNINVATIAGDSSAITLPPGGRYSFINHNFFGSSDLLRMYAVNGVGKGFEWDGSVFVYINTGMTNDKPTRVAAHRNHLFFSFPGGSLQHSSIGEPYMWELITGAAELGIGEETTDLLGSVSGTMSIFGLNNICVLYGDDADNWVIKTLTDDAGAIAWTAQMIGAPIYQDNKGLRSLDTTDAFGDFDIGTITKLVEPIFRLKRKNGVTPVASLRVRAKDQYRLFWSDGTGLTVYFGRKPVEILPFDLGFEVTFATSGKDSDGEEVLLIGDSQGMVYELDAGTSFDGEEVDAFLRLQFNHVGSPAQNKRWTKVVMEMDGGPDTNLGLTTEFSYGSPDQPISGQLDFTVAGSGGFWGEMNWSEFYWSAPVLGRAEAPIDGIGNNISITVVSSATYEEPHVLTGAILHFSYRGLAR